MLDKKNTPNALDFFDVRETKSAPKHFEFCNLTPKYNMEDSIRKWIEVKCKGRFYIGKTVSLYDGKITSMVKVGFEDPKELSFFMLACPHLKYT